MTKMIRHDYGAIHDALNKMILAEVKAALELLPENLHKPHWILSDINSYEFIISPTQKQKTA